MALCVTTSSMWLGQTHQAAACNAAGKCGYHVAPLQEVLAAGRLKYLDLLGGALAAAVGEALHRDAQVPRCCHSVHASHRCGRRARLSMPCDCEAQHVPSHPISTWWVWQA
jgi:hypothetical protein